MGRTVTGIKGFDKLIQGGFPENKIVLLTGTPGTCKTIFGLQYIYNGAQKFEEKGVFVTFEEGRESLLSQAKQFGWDLEKLEDEKKIKIISYPSDAIKKSTVDDLIKFLHSFDARRLVIDSLSALALNSPTTHAKVTDITKLSIMRFIYSFITTLRMNSRATALLISQTQEEKKPSRDSVSEFACDGIINIYKESLGGKFSRHLKIVKMRETKHNEDVNPLEIGSKGIIIHELE